MLRLGKLFGINIFADWSLTLLVVLIAYTGITSIMPNSLPGINIVVNVACSIVLAVFFVASILAHELGHSLVGRIYGITVSNIILFVFGGAAQLDTDRMPSPKSEFLMASAGPAVSFLLGILCIGVAFLIGARNLVTVILSVTGTINIFLGIFNLLPIFPCDGGRILRASLWAILKNYKCSTIFSAWVGIVGGYAFAGLGVLMAIGINVPIFGTGMGNGFWTGFIGLMIAKMAKAELMRA